MTKLLSIITICRNSENTLERTINSVICERRKLIDKNIIEYIVIDGASTDRTLDILAKNIKNIDFMKTESDNGIYDAMNKGWRFAKGDFILFLNSDDWLKENTLSKLLHLLKYAKDSKVDVISAITEMKSISTNEDYILSLLAYGTKSIVISNPVPHPSTIVSRNLLKKYDGFNDRLSIAADYEFFIQALSDNETNVIASSLPLINMQAGGASEQYKSLKNFVKIEKELLKTQIKYFGFTRALLSLILRQLQHARSISKKCK